jgi:hypothetical protein
LGELAAKLAAGQFCNGMNVKPEQDVDALRLGGPYARNAGTVDFLIAFSSDGVVGARRQTATSGSLNLPLPAFGGFPAKEVLPYSLVARPGAISLLNNAWWSAGVAIAKRARCN